MRETNLPNVFSAEISKFFCCFRKKVHNAFLAYCTGLAMLTRFRSIKRISEEYFSGNVDALHHFLKNSPCREEDFSSILNAQIADNFADCKEPPALIIDDTPIERLGPHIEGTGVHHGPKGLVKGQSVVTATLQSGGMTLGFAAKGYRPKRACPKKEFKTKIQLALEVLERAGKINMHFTVLVDVWYACKVFLTRVSEKNWRYVAAIKSNRIIFVDDRKTYVRNLAKGPREYRLVRISKCRRVRAAKRIVTIPAVGKVALFITKTGGTTRYLISNDLDLSEKEAVRFYARRWAIETWHRDIKQHLGFNEMWMRSWRTCQRHWLLTLLTYNALVLWNRSLPASRRQRTLGSIARAFRKTINAPVCIKVRHFYLKCS